MRRARIASALAVVLLACSCSVRPASGGPAVLTPVRSLETSYAQNFSVVYCEGGYVLLTVEGQGSWLVVPPGASAPSEAGEGVTVIARPGRIYLASSGAMCHFDALGALDEVAFSATARDGWLIEGAFQAMDRGEIAFAGKYSAPDYELLMSGGCDLAIENTMITRVPEVRETLVKAGVPVIVETSSYETHPLARTEWIKFYGALLGMDDEAARIFSGQEAAFNGAATGPDTGRSVAVFYLTENGMAVIRRPDDYLAAMISLAGGRYVFDELDAEGGGTLTVDMETFYEGARDADVIIYNPMSGSDRPTMDDLFARSGLLRDFKAVRTGQVWCADKSLYQDSARLGELTSEIRSVLDGSSPDGTARLRRVE